MKPAKLLRMLTKKFLFCLFLLWVLVFVSFAFFTEKLCVLTMHTYHTGRNNVTKEHDDFGIENDEKDIHIPGVCLFSYSIYGILVDIMFLVAITIKFWQRGEDIVDITKVFCKRMSLAE